MKDKVKRKNSKQIINENLSSEVSEGENLTNVKEKNCIVILNLFTSAITSDDNDNDNVKEQCLCVPINPYSNSICEEQEIVPEISLEVLNENQVQLRKLIYHLTKLGYPLKAALIYYFSKEADEYIFCGSEPVDQNIYVPISDENNSITLRCHCFIDEDFLKTISFNPLIKQQKDEEEVKTGRRTKERKIGQVIEKVSTWRKLYNGYYDENKKFIKYSLEDAAKLLNISKKSLDDYLLQLRLGRKFGFDFNLNKNNRVGILRTFVKEHRAKSSNELGLNDDTNSLI